MKSKKIILILIPLAVLVVILMYFNKGKGEPYTIDLNSGEKFFATTTSAAEKAVPDNWLLYKNKNANFSLYHPPELEVKEYDEGEGTYTIVFEEKDGKKGFQLFFTPYSQDVITSSRMLKDIPSGEFSQPVEIIIGGGERAIVFESNGSFGKMREVWFLKSGYLFEATALIEFDEEFAKIMKTWRFGII